MTIQEMYQELEEQTKEDINSIDYDIYDDSYIVEIDYTIQE